MRETRKILGTISWAVCVGRRKDAFCGVGEESTGGVDFVAVDARNIEKNGTARGLGEKIVLTSAPLFLIISTKRRRGRKTRKVAERRVDKRRAANFRRLAEINAAPRRVRRRAVLREKKSKKFEKIALNSASKR